MSTQKVDCQHRKTQKTTTPSSNDNKKYYFSIPITPFEIIRLTRTLNQKQGLEPALKQHQCQTLSLETCISQQIRKIIREFWNINTHNQ